MPGTAAGTTDRKYTTCACTGRSQRVALAAATVTATPITAASSDTTTLVHSGAMPFCTSNR